MALLHLSYTLKQHPNQYNHWFGCHEYWLSKFTFRFAATKMLEFVPADV
jgi:hypothetical protein